MKKNKSDYIIYSISFLLLIFLFFIFITLDSYTNYKYDKYYFYRDNELTTAIFQDKFDSSNKHKQELEKFNTNLFIKYDSYRYDSNYTMNIVLYSFINNDIYIDLSSSNKLFYKANTIKKSDKLSIIIDENAEKILFGENAISKSLGIINNNLKDYTVDTVISGMENSKVGTIYIPYDIKPEMSPYHTDYTLYEDYKAMYYFTFVNEKKSNGIDRYINEYLSYIPDTSIDTAHYIKNSIDYDYKKDINTFYFGIITSSLLLTLILISVFYLQFYNDKRKYSIYVVLGATKIDLIKKMLKKNLITFVISSFVALIIANLLTIIIAINFSEIQLLYKFNWILNVSLIGITNLVISFVYYLFSIIIIKTNIKKLINE